MSETTGPSTTVPASTESSSSQAAYTPSPVRQQQPQVSHPVEHASHRSGPSLTTERVQDVAGFDKSSQAAPVQGQNMATGGFRSSSGVPSEDELNELYANEAGAQVSILTREKALRRMQWYCMFHITALHTSFISNNQCLMGFDEVFFLVWLTVALFTYIERRVSAQHYMHCRHMPQQAALVTGCL